MEKVLIVDDDKHIAELISLYMMKDGFETKEVFNGNDVIAAFNSFKPNIVLLDLMLPGKDGNIVLREIRKKSAVPVIMITA